MDMLIWGWKHPAIMAALLGCAGYFSVIAAVAVDANVTAQTEASRPAPYQYAGPVKYRCREPKSAE